MLFRLFSLLPLLLAGCLGDESVSGYADPTASYALQDLNGAPFTASATIAFPHKGVVTGQGPCNSYSATQTVPYPWIRIENIAATKRACPDLAAEGAFFAALQSMTLSEVLGDVLILSNDEGGEMVFNRVQP